MRNPADLPPELFTLVLDDVLAESTVTQVCHLSLVDRKWQRFLLPRIYTEWTYDGAQHSFHSLWSFWLTVNRNPDIAGLVETLVIGNWGFNEYETLGHDFDYNLETSDLDLVRAKIRTVGLHDQEETILEDLARGDRRPIMAFLLTCFPNVTAIDAHVPRSDPVWGSALRCILAQHKRASATDRTISDGAPIPFTHLTSVRLWCEVYIETNLDLNGAYEDRARLRLDDVWPLIFLPGLETLGLYEVDFQGMLGILGGQGHATIQDLTVACASHSEAVLENFQAFMAAMRRLQRFSFSFDDMYCGFADNDPPLVVSNSDLWPILERHQQSLQVLDIYRHGDRRSYNRQIGHTDELTRFRQLQHLSLSVDTLLGGDTESPPLPTLLRDSLPAGLQTLIFYRGEGLKMIYDLEAQIANAVSSKKFLSLKYITFEDMHHSNFARAVSESQSLQYILRTAGTSIFFVSSNPYQDPLGANYKLVAGGRNPTLSLESYQLRLSGQQRYEMIMDQINPMEDTDPEPSNAEDMHFGRGERYCLPFTDHRGSTAYMVFDAYVECPLPKLYSFAVYLTHRDIDPHHPDIHDSLKAFYEAAISTDFDDLVVPDIWRLDFYFVPGATDTECTEHFHGELAVRGSFNATIRRYREYRRADPPREPPMPPGTLPGMVDWYDDHLGAGKMLFICEDIPDLTVAAKGSDPRWVMWQVWFGSKPTRKPWEMEEWEREHFGLSGYDNGPPQGWVDENAGDGEGTGNGD
ncbi:hypothetical protein BJX63DRAFT_437345 [Aspergillus granulosus]|uniref:F-box domain-containing protein n=1 Tax=Aspergillus granulosus TaxID=176169 RepID=A0ABR4GVD1_9EURO